MPMLDIQRRHAEVFRIRLGEKLGNRPAALKDSMRITSASKSVCEKFAAVYGGEVTEFAEDASKHAWQVKLPITEIPVMILPGNSISQWWEKWKGSVCERRCDGAFESLTGERCLCPADISARMDDSSACRPTTRLSIICPEVDVLGAGALVTHSLIAAETLPQAVIVAEETLRRGNPVPAILRAVWNKGKNHYLVPQLEVVGVSYASLTAGEVPEVPNVKQIENRPKQLETRPTKVEQREETEQPKAALGGVKSAPAKSDDGITEPQIRMIRSLLAGLNVKDNDDVHARVGALLDRDVDSLKDLHKADARAVIDLLKVEAKHE
jgi:hypothetical protein